MKRQLIVLGIFIFSLTTANAQKSEIFSPAGLAIKGYDVVSFFKNSQAEKGYDSLAYKWKEASWLFATKANLEAFKANPEKYAPQYGGYCAFGTAQGHKAPTETDTWTVVDGKLYFNYNTKVKTLWMKDQQALILKANDNWPAIKDKE